jgi:chitodextrinase
VVARYLLAANKPPTVSITSPLNNSVYYAPATITVSAKALDTDGAIAKVEFYNGTTLLKSDITSPYSFPGLMLPAGTYYLKAKATDNFGLSTTSAIIKVSVLPNKAPVVNITNPLNNAVYTAGATINISASASDADGTIKSVKFYRGTTC